MKKQTLPKEVIDRYWNMLSHVEAKQEEELGTSLAHIKWMVSELRIPKEIGKHNRWLGFIQYALIVNGLTTTTAERNFTRPYFTKPTLVQRVVKFLTNLFSNKESK